MLARSTLEYAVRDFTGDKANVTGTYRVDEGNINTAYRIDVEEKGLLFSSSGSYYAKEGDVRGEIVGSKLAGYAGLPTYRIKQYKGFGLMESAPGDMVIKSRNAIDKDPKRFAYEIGKVCAYDFVFGVGDGHAKNVFYDGKKATRIDMESVLMTDMVDTRYVARDFLDNLTGYHTKAETLKPHLRKGFDDAYKSIRSNKGKALGTVKQAVRAGIEVGDGYGKKRVDPGVVSEVDRRIGMNTDRLFDEIFDQYQIQAERRRR